MFTLVEKSYLMRVCLSFVLMVLIHFSGFGQEKNTTKVERERIFVLDTSWTIGTSVHTPLIDSISYMLIYVDTVEFYAASEKSVWKEKGVLIRLKEQFSDTGLETISFYLTKRGGLKGSLTVIIREQANGKYEFQMVSPFATIDKRMVARVSSIENVKRSETFKKKPKKK
jgi:hypothetical protein